MHIHIIRLSRYDLKTVIKNDSLYLTFVHDIENVNCGKMYKLFIYKFNI